MGLDDVQVSPRFVYADASRPGWVDGFTRKTFIAMVEGAEEPALRLGLIDKAAWDDGIADLTADVDHDLRARFHYFAGQSQPGCEPEGASSARQAA